jgi:hypothetical protein
MFFITIPFSVLSGSGLSFLFLTVFGVGFADMFQKQADRDDELIRLRQQVKDMTALPEPNKLKE